MNSLASKKKGFGKNPMFTIWTDDNIIKGSYCFSAMEMIREEEREKMLLLGKEGEAS